jgi:hypothetical protein
MALTQGQNILLKKDIPAWTTPDTSQNMYGSFLNGTTLTVVAQTGNVVQVRSNKPPRSGR